jgi:GNAT superfamily N-acetyltransferase
VSIHLVRAGDYEISDERARLDVVAIHRYLAEDSYWAQGRPFATVVRAISRSFVLGAYAPDGSQAGFLRLVTDWTLTGHLNDVFVLPAHRGLGLSTAMLSAMFAHPDLATLTRWTLSTTDAHALYARFGFAPFPDPTRQMIRRAASPSITPPLTPPPAETPAPPDPAAAPP